MLLVNKVSRENKIPKLLGSHNIALALGLRIMYEQINTRNKQIEQEMHAVQIKKITRH